MINIGVVCHSSEMADKIIEFVEIFKSEDFKIVNLGKNDSNELGTTVSEIKENILKNNDNNPYLVFVDMGSSIDNIKKVAKELKDIIQIEISSAPLLEGLITAVTANEKDMDIKTLKLYANESKNFKKV